jgi:rubrerythrin
MTLDSKLKPWEILSVGIRSEIDAAGFYTRLQARVKNVILIQKLKFLATEEEHHKKILERLFRDRFSDRTLGAPEASWMPPIAADLGENPSVPALFHAALKAEEAAERFYDDASGRVADEGSRKILGYLGRVERSHQAMIRSEIDLLEKFPDYYNVEDWHIGGDLFHIGP